MSDDRLNRIEGKVDKIVEHVSSIDVTLAKQHESLKDHIRRSDLLEQKLIPVEKHVAMMQGALKLIGLMATLAGIAAAVIEMLKYLGH